MTKYRVDIDYIDIPSEDSAMLVSVPCKTLKDVFDNIAMSSREKCIDDNRWIPHIKVEEYMDGGLFEIWNNEIIRIGEMN